MNPAHEGDILKRPHVYVKRPDGSSGYEPLDRVLPEVKTEARPPLLPPEFYPIPKASGK